MKHLAAYLLLGLGGNTSPSAKDVKAVLESVGIEADDERLNKLIAELKGKDLQEVRWVSRVQATTFIWLTNCSWSPRVPASWLPFHPVGVEEEQPHLEVLLLGAPQLQRKRRRRKRKKRRKRSRMRTWASDYSTRDRVFDDMGESNSGQAHNVERPDG